MLECVVNLSTGDNADTLDRLVRLCGSQLLNVHTDRHHNRSVFTLLGVEAPRILARAAVEHLDIANHAGVHPRLGVVDVVPFVPIGTSTLTDALVARDEFASFASSELEIPVFLYGGEQRTLPEIRRNAWADLAPDLGPGQPHPSAGAMCVGARGLLVAYNVWLKDNDLLLAQRIARSLRGPDLRALGLQVGDRVQVSMNLIHPTNLGPMEAFDLVAEQAAVSGAELVGLVPKAVLETIPGERWGELDLSVERSLEAS
jgi:glutamate formiminotransferase / 5-formyltetrahydrofolate cyclo-ligase